MNKNEQKIQFKKVFIGHLKDVQPGSTITDQALKAIVTQNYLSLGLSDIQQCLRTLESEIGTTLRIRLVRIRKEGYQVLNGDEQYFQADNEGKKKLKKVFKKQVKRLDAVDLQKVSTDLRITVQAKSMAYSALAQLANAALSNRKLTAKDVGLITSANNELKAIEQLRKAGF